MRLPTYLLYALGVASLAVNGLPSQSELESKSKSLTSNHEYHDGTIVVSALRRRDEDSFATENTFEAPPPAKSQPPAKQQPAPRPTSPPGAARPAAPPPRPTTAPRPAPPRPTSGPSAPKPAPPPPPPAAPPNRPPIDAVMGDVVYMNKATGTWKKWHINANGRPGPVTTGGTAQPGGKKIRAPGLASCMSLNIISQTAAITVHFPGYLCNRIPGYTGPRPPVGAGTDYQTEYDQLKAKILELLAEHRGDFGRTQVHAVQGPSGVLSRADTFIRDLTSMLRPPLTIDGNWQISIMHDSGNPRETVVNLDVTPSTFTYGRTTVTVNP